jgi:hypothetical protein
MNKVTIELTIRVNDEVASSALFDPTGILTQADWLAGEASLTLLQVCLRSLILRRSRFL